MDCLPVCIINDILYFLNFKDLSIFSSCSKYLQCIIRDDIFKKKQTLFLLPPEFIELKSNAIRDIHGFVRNQVMKFKKPYFGLMQAIIFQWTDEQKNSMRNQIKENFTEDLLVFQQAIENNFTDIVEFKLSKMNSVPLEDKGMQLVKHCILCFCARAGNIEALEMCKTKFEKNYGQYLRFDFLGSYAAYWNQEIFVKYLFDQKYITQFSETECIYINAAERGFLSLIQLCEKTFITDMKNDEDLSKFKYSMYITVLMTSIVYAQEHVIIYCLPRCKERLINDISNRQKLLESVSYYGRLKLLKYFMKELSLPLRPNVVEIAATKGHQHVIKYALKLNILSLEDLLIILRNTILSNNVSCFQYVESQVFVLCNGDDINIEHLYKHYLLIAKNCVGLNEDMINYLKSKI